MGNLVFDSTVDSLNNALNLRLTNQNVISTNIANADTPGYKAKSVEFESALRDALGVGDQLPLEGSHPDHIVSEAIPIEGDVFEEPYDSQSLDKNTVNRSKEMAKMSENQILFNADTEMLKKKIGMTKYAIGDGGER